MISIFSESDNCDLYERYKMPKIKVELQGKGINVKTQITNLTDVCKALQRPADQVLKYFSLELGTHVYLNTKYKNTYKMKGNILAETLQERLKKYIQKYIVCQACQSPDTNLVKQSDQVCLQCKCCGAFYVISNCSNKFANYIMKSLPSNDLKNRVEETKQNQTFNQDNDNNLKDNEEEKRIKGSNKSKINWTPHYTSQDLTINSKILQKMIKKLKEFYSTQIAPKLQVPEENQDELINLCQKGLLKCRIDLGLIDRYIYLISVMIFDIKNMGKQIPLNAFLIKGLISKLEINESPYQIHMILTLQHIFLKQNSESAVGKYISTILKLFLDSDLFTEEFLLDWYDNKLDVKLLQSNFIYEPSLNSKFQKYSQDFINWLKSENDEAEEEDDDDAEEEDQDDAEEEKQTIEYHNQQNINEIKESQTFVTKFNQ